MSLLAVVLLTGVILTVAYLTYGPLLARLFELRADVATPAETLRDDVDYVPIEPKFLLSQHLSAIAAAGPIVGPILAGLAFGWLPALIWILVGSVFIGGVHDMSALVASVRHKARSIAEVVRDHMTRRSYVVFLLFVWLSLVYIVVAFTDITASSFIGMMELENGDTVLGGSVASSSLMYLILPIVMGLLLRYTRLSLNLATAIFLPLVGLSIWGGQFIPLRVENFFGMEAVRAELDVARRQAAEALPQMSQSVFLDRYTHPVELATLLDDKTDDGERELGIIGPTAVTVRDQIQPAMRHYYETLSRSQTAWNVALLLYCVVASVVPLWLLLQPRGHLGGYFLYVALAGGVLGLLFGAKEVKYPAFIGWHAARGEPLVPLLFITIACGACSGFHSIIASGTTSKQLRRETDARVIGYGAMLLEAMVAVVSLCCLMMLASDDRLLRGEPKPNLLYANGLGQFLEVIRIPAALGVSFGLMAFTTFVYDTLDVCTRLGRYILQELTGWHGRVGRWSATLVTAGTPLFFLLRQPIDATGRVIPAWRTFWGLFGASNQLLAALTLMGVTVWLWRTRRQKWVWFVTGMPCVFMYTVSMWALTRMVVVDAAAHGWSSDPRSWRLAASAMSAPSWIAALLMSLGILMLVEAVKVLWQSRRLPPANLSASPALATGT